MKKNNFLVTIKFLVIILASSTYGMEAEEHSNSEVDPNNGLAYYKFHPDLPSSAYGMEAEEHSNSEFDPNNGLAYYKFHPDLPWDKKKYRMESERNFKKQRLDDSLPTTSSPYGIEVEEHSNSEVDPNNRLACYKFHPDLPWDKKNTDMIIKVSLMLF